MTETTSAAPGRTTGMGERWIAPILLLVAAAGWWCSAVSTRSMRSDMSMDAGDTLSFAGFVVAWVAMMAAMMLPAVLPVVRLYRRAARTGAVAPVPVFLAGYGVMWSAIAVPAYLAWHQLQGPLAMPSPTTGRLIGVTVLVAGAYQLSPLKAACLRHCRSPLSLFMQHGNEPHRRLGAFRVGAHHGLYCLGCCWMLMAVLVAFGTMQPGWMLALAVVILVEKTTPIGARLASVVGITLFALGALLIVHPATVSHLV